MKSHIHFSRWHLLLLLAMPRLAFGFDAPVTVQHVDLGMNEDKVVHLRATCSYFKTFMVKEIQYDPGAKGGDAVSVLPITHVGTLPACQKLQQVDEFPMDPGDGGYLIGAKSNYIFLDDFADPGPAEFSVYDAQTGRKLFTDHYEIERQISSVALKGTNLVMHYRRAAVGNCSVPTDGRSCWAQLGKAFHIPIKHLPRHSTEMESHHAKLLFARRNCMPPYATAVKNTRAACIEKQMAAPMPAFLATTNTIISYPVAASWDGSTLVITPVDGRIDWWPSN